MKKLSGILLHISSLPNSYGIGTFGESAYQFVDFLVKSGFSYWQVLPLNQTSFGDSPYQSFSTYAGNPYFIDFDLLSKQGLLNKQDYSLLNWGEETSVDYGLIYQNKYAVLRKAVKNFKDNEEYKLFINNNLWLDNYALFMAIKDSYNGLDLLNWPIKYKLKDEEAINNFINSHQEEIRFYKVIQYFFYDQYFKLKKYANDKGIKIIGDCPIYVAMDSCDVWLNPELFEMSKKLKPRKIAGVPPDYFSETGQLWGNPIYKWSLMKKDNYTWWINRIKHLSLIYDTIRIDHFRGFESYYSIDYGMSDGKIGEWKKGPGIKLFKEINKQLGDIDIIAEDLGIITDKVRKLLKRTKYPGMKVLEFAFDGSPDNPYLPKNCKYNSVYYCGTHDNETIMEWINKQNEQSIKYILSVLKLNSTKNINIKMLETILKSKSYLAIITMQDILGLGQQARMNEPGTLGKNWKWRLADKQINDDLANKLYKLNKKYKRIVE